MKDDCLESVMVHFGKLVYERFNRLQPGIMVWIHYSTKRKQLKTKCKFLDHILRTVVIRLKQGSFLSTYFLLK